MPIPGPNPFSPRQATFATSNGALIQWSNATNFDGYMLVGLSYPLTGGTTAVPNITKGAGSEVVTELPIFAKIPIYWGTFDQGSYLWFNSDIDPPNTQYFYWFYANDDVQIATGAAPFTISASPCLITIPTLTVPTLNSTPPTPD